jgi:hypothetical protein
MVLVMGHRRYTSRARHIVLRPGALAAPNLSRTLLTSMRSRQELWPVSLLALLSIQRLEQNKIVEGVC